MASTILQDFVVYCALLGVVMLYRTRLRKSAGTSERRGLVVGYTWAGIGLSTWFVGSGILFQVGMVNRVAAYALFGAGIAVLFFCLRAFRRRVSQIISIDEWNRDAEGK